MAETKKQETAGCDLDSTPQILPTEEGSATLRQDRTDRFTSAFRYAAVGMALVSPQGRFLQVNRALCELSGYSETELTSENFQSLTHLDDLDNDVAHLQMLLRGEIESFRTEKRYKHKDGHWIWILLSVSLILSANGKPLYFISQIQDISQRKSAEFELRERKREIQSVLDNVPDLITRTDGNFQIRYINRAVEAVFGRPASHFLGKTLAEAGVPEDVGRIVGRCVRQVFETGKSVVSQYDILPDGATETDDAHHFQVRMVPEYDAEGALVSVLSVARDITELTRSQSRLLEMQHSLQESNRQLAEANLELEKLAHLDGLTGLKNRRAFDDRLRDEINRAQRTGEPFSLVIMDVDHFKNFNDNHGHVAGDETLRLVASILEKTLRPIDTIARYGGEEFTMILPSTGQMGSERAAQRCCQALLEFAWPKTQVTGSFGVATWNGEDAQTLLVRADVALYTAKKEGRNCVFHANSLASHS